MLLLAGGIALYAERVYLSAPSVMTFTEKSPMIPNYEGRAIAYIIVVMKILLGMDDITEKKISEIADKINRYVNKTSKISQVMFKTFQCL